ncbi:Protein angel 2 [Mortierella alpina]|nr:Protein angel 2 [Mortierella alpina]
MEPDGIKPLQHPPSSGRDPTSDAPAIQPPAATSRESAQTFYRRHGQQKHAVPAANLASTTKALKEIAITVADDDKASTSTKNKAHARVVATKNRNNNKAHSRTKQPINTAGASSTSGHRSTAGEHEPYRRPKGSQHNTSTKDGSQNSEAHSIYTTNLDIFCLQELDEQDYLHAFEPMFRSRGYHGSFKKRTGSKVDGCALFYLKSRIRAQCIDFVEYQANAFACTSENVGIVAILDVIGKGSTPTKSICVATTHILFNHRRGMIKLAQLKMLLDRAEILMKQQSCAIPIVLCGDLNIVPDSLLMRFLMSKYVDVSMMPEHFMSGTDGVYRGSVKYFENNVGRFHEAFAMTAGAGTGRIGLPALAKPHGHGDANMTYHPLNTGLNPLDPIVSQPFNFENVYSGRKSFGHHGEIFYQNAESYNRQWTTFHKRARITCDYILYGQLRGAPSSHGYKGHPESGHGLEVSARLKLPCIELSETHGMPTRDFGSDHLSLAAWFNIV